MVASTMNNLGQYHRGSVSFGNRGLTLIPALIAGSPFPKVDIQVGAAFGTAQHQIGIRSAGEVPQQIAAGRAAHRFGRLGLVLRVISVLGILNHRSISSSTRRSFKLPGSNGIQPYGPARAPIRSVKQRFQKAGKHIIAHAKSKVKAAESLDL